MEWIRAPECTKTQTERETFCYKNKEKTKFVTAKGNRSRTFYVILPTSFSHGSKGPCMSSLTHLNIKARSGCIAFKWSYTKKIIKKQNHKKYTLIQALGSSKVI